MEYYINLDGIEYLIPMDVLLLKEKLFKEYTIVAFEKKYLDLDKLITEDKFDEVLELYNIIKNVVGTYAIDMEAIGMYGNTNDSFDPFGEFFRLKRSLTDMELLVEYNKNNGDIDKAYAMLQYGIKRLLELNEKMIKKDNYDKNNIK